MRPPAVALVACIGVIGCAKASDSIVVVRVEAAAGVTGVMRLRATLSNASVSASELFPATTPTAPLVFPTAFSASFGRARTGSLDIAIDALDSSGATVANGALDNAKRHLIAAGLVVDRGRDTGRERTKIITVRASAASAASALVRTHGRTDARDGVSFVSAAADPPDEVEGEREPGSDDDTPMPWSTGLLDQPGSAP